MPTLDLRLIAVPYHLGQPRISTGLGPEALLAAGAHAAVERAGWQATVEVVEVDEELTNEIGAAFAVSRALAARVRDAVDHGAFPLVLSGNCNNCIGILAGLNAADLGIVWFDAHADFNTPETSTSGFLEGMALAIAAGGAWPAIARTVPGFRPVPEERVLLIGARALDDDERRRLDASSATLVRTEHLRQDGVAPSLQPSLAQLRTRTGQVYLHLDLDVLDPAEGRANPFAAPGGPTVDEIAAAIETAGEHLTIRGASVGAYDPASDPDGRVAAAALRLIGVLAKAARQTTSATA